MSVPSRFHLAIIVPVLLILVGIALFLGLRKTVTLSVDGKSRTLTTYAFTVGSLLHAEDITLSSQDNLTPSQDTWLKNGETVALLRAIPVQVLTDGKLFSIYSTNRIPMSILTQVGVSLLPGDQVLSNGRAVDPDLPFPLNIQSISLQVNPSESFTFTDEEQDQTLTSTAPTLGSALWAVGYRFFAADKLEPPAQTPLTQGLSASVQYSRQVTVQTQIGSVGLRTAAETVGEALDDANLSIQGLDYSLPSPEDSIPADGAIQLVRVTEDVLVEQSPLPFDTQYQAVFDLELDSQSIVQTGEYGLNAQRVRILYEDGQEISRLVEDQWIARQPVPRIIGYGTMVTMHTEMVDGIQIQYWRKLNMYALSYHPSNTGNTTASGLPLQKGVAAVDTSLIPFYTQMYIPGYGETVAADIGGGVFGRMIDLGYSDDNYVPWHQWVTVYFLWPPPANIVWIVP
jgi:uncharacterized protein YabE (DUF348 family)